MDTMSAQKDDLGREKSQLPRKENLVGHLTGSQKGSASRRSLAHPSIGGYVTGESTWSQNYDSAASMFPLARRWEEDYQDLSIYCQNTEHNMSSGKVDVIKSSSCIVPGDELNTPEICIPEFDYSAHGRVVSRDDTSPMSLFDGGEWDPPVDITQISTYKESNDGVTPFKLVEPIKSQEKYIQTTNEAVILKSEMEVNEIWITSMDHEEEVISVHENMTVMEDSVCENVDNTIEVIVDQNQSLIDTVDNEEANVQASLKYLESLFNTTTNELSSQNNDTDNIKLEPDTYMMEIEPQSSEVPVEIISNDDLVHSVAAQSVDKPLGDRNQLTLNLAEVLATDDLISTPVILDMIAEGEVTTPFDKLLEFLQADTPEVKVEKIEIPPVSSTVDFSAVSTTSSANSNLDNGTKPVEKIVNVEIVKPVVIKKSPNGQLSVSQKQESTAQNGRTGIGRKKIVMNKITKKIPQNALKETGSVLKQNISNKQNSKRKLSAKEVSVPKPRGRPAREPTPSTSRVDDTRPKRQRKLTEDSDYDYDDISSPSSSKRSRLSSVESDSGKYRELRDRNNEASRKSRFNRKLREHDMKDKAEALERENQSLKIKADEMERLVKKLRQALLEAVTKGKTKDE